MRLAIPASVATQISILIRAIVSGELIGAKNGQVECQRQVADMLILGVGTEKNEKEAVYWLKQAASNGSLDAELKLLKLLTDNRC